MEALLVLDLRTYVASLPSSFSCLVNLKALFLFLGHENFDVTSLSLIGELKNLEILQLHGFEFCTLPEEFGNLTSLRCLDLLYCKGTIPRNLISRLSILEQLYLTDVFSNWQVDDGSSGGDAATFAELASLKYLTTLHVDIENPDIFLQQQDLNSVPWPALTDFKIAVGTEFDFEPSRSRSRQLVVTKSTYKYKWVIDLVTKTERLCLHNWSGMECLIGGVEEGFTDAGHKLFEVKELDLRSMPDMKSLCTGTLPNDILRKLSALQIEDCHKLIDVLPTSMLLRTHQLMESLVIRSCDQLEKVLSLNFVQEEEEEGQSAAAGIVLLPRLEWIRLWELPELRSVWGDDGVIMLSGSLQNLKTLYVGRCKSLKDHILPPILPIPSLRELDIYRCDSLTYLLSWRQAKGLPRLQSLEVGYCDRMETIIKAATDDDDDDESLASSVQLLPQLDSIHLYCLPRLMNFCVYLEADFPSLRRLDIYRCASLTYLLSWRQAKGLPHLQTLSVRECERMETLIKEEEGGATDDDHKEEEEESTVIPSLTELTLNNLPVLRSFQGEQCSKSVLSTFNSLKELEVAECPKLKKLPLSSSTVLESLRGDNWEWFESFEWGEDKSIKERLRAVFQPSECDDGDSFVSAEDCFEEEMEIYTGAASSALLEVGKWV